MEGIMVTSVTFLNNVMHNSISVIVRVYIEDRLVRDSGVNYRCIRVTEHDRVKQVLSVALAKHNLVAEQPQNWNLTQKLTPKELTLPDNANVFHAIDKTPQNNGQLIEFVIRRKTKEEIQEWLKPFFFQFFFLANIFALTHRFSCAYTQSWSNRTYFWPGQFFSAKVGLTPQFDFQNCSA